jgi:hypothetical protein
MLSTAQNTHRVSSIEPLAGHESRDAIVEHAQARWGPDTVCPKPRGEMPGSMRGSQRGEREWRTRWGRVCSVLTDLADRRSDLSLPRRLSHVRWEADADEDTTQRSELKRHGHVVINMTPERMRAQTSISAVEAAVWGPEGLMMLNTVYGVLRVRSVKGSSIISRIPGECHIQRLQVPRLPRLGRPLLAGE